MHTYSYVCIRITVNTRVESTNGSRVYSVFARSRKQSSMLDVRFREDGWNLSRSWNDRTCIYVERFANRISDVLQTFPLVCRENYGIEHDIVLSDRHDRSRYIYCIINGVIEIVQTQKYFTNVILWWLEQVLIWTNMEESRILTIIQRNSFHTFLELLTSFIIR